MTVDPATTAAASATPAASGEPIGRIATAPPQAIFVDAGRIGWAHLAVTAAGPFDRRSFHLANRLVGNAETATAVEFLLGPLEISFHRAVTVAVTGITAELSVSDCTRHTPSPRGHGATHTTVSLPAGVVLRVGTASSGLRGYLAVRGGFDAPVTLGSRSTDTLAGLGPPPLRRGTPLLRQPIATSTPRTWAPLDTWHHETHREPGRRSEPTVIAVHPPPRPIPAANVMHQLTSTTWVIAPDSSRIGVRLTGGHIDLPRDPHTPSEPLIAGAIQLPPEGAPIIMGPDHPTTGGYPVIGVVRESDLDLLAQLRPGAQVRLRLLST